MAQPANPAAPASGAPEELMHRIQRGDMHAYQELIRCYQRKVFRVISGYVHNPEDAMEVLQDTFLKVYSSRHSWDHRHSLSGWLYRIAINASIDRYRRSDRGRTASLEDVTETRLQESASSHPPGNPLDGMHERERRRVLEQAVRRLPQRQREVVCLRYFAEMKLEEIAAALDCPLGTVKSNLHKAVTGLKGMLVAKRGVLGYE
jgi:RNA polymerase sigma-70 factor (ECF subfamily)